MKGINGAITKLESVWKGMILNGKVHIVHKTKPRSVLVFNYKGFILSETPAIFFPGLEIQENIIFLFRTAVYDYVDETGTPNYQHVVYPIIDFIKIR